MNKYTIMLVAKLIQTGGIKQYHIPVVAESKKQAMDKAIGMVDKNKLKVMGVSVD